MRANLKNKISIVIPFYKGEVFLGDLLSSLSDSYARSSKRLTPEVIVINDSPKEVPEADIRAICNNADSENNLNIQILTNPENKGVAYSRDLGTSRASGEYLTWIDQDDVVSAHYFSILEQRLSAQQNIYLLNGYLCKPTIDKAIPMFYFKPTVNFNRVLFSNPILSTSFWVVNRAFLTALNARFYRPELTHKGVDDWFFSLQLTQQKQPLEYVPNRLILYRFHEQNFGHNIAESTAGVVELLTLLQNDPAFPKHKLRARLKTAQFSKQFYTQNKLSSILRNPLSFVRFLIHYSCDVNRLIRLIHKQFRRINVRP